MMDRAKANPKIKWLLDSQVVDALAHPVFVGLDQANVRISRTLAGRGDVDVVFVADGQMANTLKTNIK